MVRRDTIIRTVLLALALINQLLTAAGRNPLPLDEGFGDLIAAVFTTGAALWAWWKNNSFTRAAIEGDKLMMELKSK